MNANPSVQPEPVFGRFWLASPRGAFVARRRGALLSMAVAVPFLIVDGFGIWLGLIPFAVVGAVIARRQPGNPVGPIMLLLTFAIVASADAGAVRRRALPARPPRPAARAAGGLSGAGRLDLAGRLPAAATGALPRRPASRRWRGCSGRTSSSARASSRTNAWQNGNGVLARHIRVDASGQLASNGTGGTAADGVVIILLYLAFGARLGGAAGAQLPPLERATIASS